MSGRQLPRRAVLGGSAALAAAAAAPAATAALHPDARLIALHAEHDAIERRYAALFEAPVLTVEQEIEIIFAGKPLLAAQERLLPALGAERATTLAGLAARLRTLVLRDSFDVSLAVLLASEDYSERLLGLLLRDMAGIAGVGRASA